MEHLVIALLLVGGISPAFAMTVHVPADQPTIQAGINAAVDGDTVLVAPGTYTGNIDFSGKTIKVLGSGSSNSLLLSSTVAIALGEGPGTEFGGFDVAHGYVALGGGASPTIHDCIFRNCTEEVVINCQVQDALIIRNLFCHNGGISCIGIYSGSARIINNTFDSNASGFFSVSARGEGRNNIVTNSVGYGVAGSLAVLEYNDIWGNHPDYSEGPTAGVGSFSANPEFSNPSELDYTLQPGSPCIKTGDPNYLYPPGTSNDVGAYAFTYHPPIVRGLSCLPVDSGGHVSSFVPEFLWEYVDTLPTQQCGYEIEVGSHRDWFEADMWHPGPVISDTKKVYYSGSPLADHKTYYARVRLSNGFNWGAWSYSTFTIRNAGGIIRVPQDQPTVPDAINAALDGDTVVMSPGNHLEGDISFQHKSIRLFGSGTSQTFLQAGTITVDNAGTGAELAYFTGSSVSIALTGTSGSTVHDCVFHDCTSGVIGCSAPDALITRNLFYHNTQVGGAACIATSSGRIINNTFDGNDLGILQLWGVAEVRNNIITNSIQWGILGVIDVSEYNDVWGNHPDYQFVVPGTGSISVDPQYVDRGSHNYNLQTSSPCRNSGDPAPQYNNPDGSRADMGGVRFSCCLTGEGRGDVDGNGRVDLADLSYLVVYLTLTRQPLPCRSASNVNEVGIIDSSDLSLLVGYLSGAVPQLPTCQ